MKKIFFILASALLLFSCEKEADIPLPETDPKLVVSCFISPDMDSALAYIQWSRPVFSSEDIYRPYDNLEVSISDGNSTAYFQYDIYIDQYVLPLSEFPLALGVEYALRVKAPTGEEVVARTTIPVEMPTVESATLDSSSYINNFGEEINEFIYKTTLTDNSDDFQYYRFIYYNEDFWVPGKSYRYIEGMSYRDDESLVDGKIYVEENITYYGYNGAFSNKQLAVLSCSESYYRYHKTLQNQSNGNPFAEPTLVYSNVEGGLGAFGAYRMTVVDY
ncbi:MAG: DUF4249 domain-containing protein [Flavobacteriales bacterium]|jgi:hypothetical protein